MDLSDAARSLPTLHGPRVVLRSGRPEGAPALRAVFDAPEVARWWPDATDDDIDERGHHRLVIDPNAANVRAIRAYEKVGFRRVGVLRQYEWHQSQGGWTDGLLMDLLRDELVDG
jgi:hypothetical protein